jgi:hypothetical protein
MPRPPRAVKMQGKIIPAILPLIPVQRTGSNVPPCPAWEERLAMEFGARKDRA